MSLLIAEVEAQRHKVVVESYTPTWNELLDQYKNKDLVIDPAYQRAFRWSEEQQTKYIESILLNIPTPPIFLAEMPDGKFEVIDGLQRFSTIVRFFSAELFKSAKHAPASAQQGEYLAHNDVQVPTVLTEAPILKGLAGLSKDAMPETLVRTLRYARIQVILLKKESSELARYNVFTRLNRAGTILSNQEIRNCSARLFTTGFADKLMNLGQRKAVAKSMRLSATEAKSMGVQENVLRLIAFCHFVPNTQRIEEFLDDTMYQLASGKVDFSSKIEQAVTNTFDVLFAAYPGGEAFRFNKDGKFKGGFSSNLFDIVACGIYKNVDVAMKRPVQQTRDLIVRLHQQREAIALTGAGSNTKAKMIGRVDYGSNWFA